MHNEGTLWLVDFEDWLRTESVGSIPNSARLFVDHLIQELSAELLRVTGKVRIERRTLPVPVSADHEANLRAYRTAVAEVLDAVVETKDRMLAFGQGSWFQAPLRIETQAVNRLVSIDGKTSCPIVEGGGDLMVQRPFSGEGLEVSSDAGTYYCNALLYWMLSRAVRGDFFHLPVFMQGDEAKASALFQANVEVFERNHPGKTAKDFAMSSNEEAARVLLQYLQAQRPRI